jgi:hypothetical protein
VCLCACVLFLARMSRKSVRHPVPSAESNNSISGAKITRFVRDREAKTYALIRNVVPTCFCCQEAGVWQQCSAWKSTKNKSYLHYRRRHLVVGHPFVYMRWLISIWLYKKKQATGLKKYIFFTYSPWAPHTYVFLVLTSLTHPEKFFWLCWKKGTGKAKDLSAPLRTFAVCHITEIRQQCKLCCYCVSRWVVFLDMNDYLLCK